MNKQRERERRFTRLKAMGCICCRLHVGAYRYPEIHHLNLDGKAGQRRRGDRYTIPLCLWHHQGKVTIPGSPRSMALMLGPSLAKSSRAFREKFGSDDELLAMTDELLAGAERVAAGAR